MPLLSVSSYSKSFTVHHLGRSIPAFENLSFELNSGQFMLISGHNGAGKSTLLRCLYRTYLPTGGHAIYNSLRGPVDLSRAADADIMLLRREEIGFVTQFLRPRPRVSALDLVAEPLLLNGSSWEEARAEAGQTLANFHIKRDLWGAYPTTFSGGEQQRVNLARALIAPRRLLLLDEPTASLDVTARQSLTQRLSELKALGVTMIGIFHHAAEVQHLIDSEIHLEGEAIPYVAD